MPISKQSTWHHSNRYNADAVCPHCAGLVRHEPWCVTQNADVRYAFEVAFYPDRLTALDVLILHALGVSWA
jgi:hypothetical protein